MSKNEEGYADYIQHISNITSGLVTLAGFLLTVITLLLTQLPDPSILQSQVVLLFLTVVSYLIGWLVLDWGVYIIYFCRKVPPLSKRTATNNIILYLVTLLFLLSLPMMFLLWNLTFLAITTAVMWVVYCIAVIMMIIRPFREFRK